MWILLLACVVETSDPSTMTRAAGAGPGGSGGTASAAAGEPRSAPASGSVSLVSEATCQNPCTFSAQVSGAVASLRYDADGYLLGTATPASPTIAYTFSQLGDREIRVTALDGTGAELAADHRTVTVTGEETEGGLGVWLWYIEGTGMDHATLAARLATLGVRRIYIKVADGDADCSAWPELCDHDVPAIYRSAGIEPWAWAYVYPGSGAAQASALSRAAQTGYAGYILDMEVEFDGQSGTLTDTMEAFSDARAAVMSDGTVGADWQLRVTTWGNPTDHDMRIDIIDRYVDAHMPQTYVEVWGSSYMADAADWVQSGTCEYRALGATKPIHHVVSTEYGDIRPAQIDSFIRASGPETSVWRVPGGGTPTSIWDDWAQVDWTPTAFDAPDCP